MNKYIRFDDGSFKIFDGSLQHSNQCDGKEPVSAGFVTIYKGELTCFGESTSLGIKSRSDDSAALVEWLSHL